MRAPRGALFCTRSLLRRSHCERLDSLYQEAGLQVRRRTKTLTLSPSKGGYAIYFRTSIGSQRCSMPGPVSKAGGVTTKKKGLNEHLTG